MRRARLNARPNIKDVPVRPILHLLHRIGIFICAVVYVYMCFDGFVEAFKLLYGDSPFRYEYSPDSAPLIRQNIGTTTIRDSPLIVQMLQDNTDPRTDTLYLDKDSLYSWEICDEMTPNQQNLYNNDFLRELYTTLVDNVSYNLTFLATETIELIAPVVDCTSEIIDDDITIARLYYLVRKVNQSDDVSMLTLTVSNQEYAVPALKETGAAAIATLTLIDDLTAMNVTHHFIASLGYPFKTLDFQVYEYLNTTTSGVWWLRSIPVSTDEEVASDLRTACRTGFYADSEAEQANINNELWVLSNDPIAAIADWEWTGRAELQDSWAWVHFVHLLLGMDVLSNLLLLLLVSCRHVQSGQLWMGDAFISVSTTIILRGALVLLTWGINGFWTLRELCLFDGTIAQGDDDVKIYIGIIRADLLSMYMSASGILGIIFRERVDPLVVMVTYIIGFHCRHRITNLFPSLTSTLVDSTHADYILGMQMPLPNQRNISPMNSWSVHELGAVSNQFIFGVLSPLGWMLLVVMLYIVYRKVKRWILPTKPNIGGVPISSRPSESIETLMGHKRLYTIFEIATGAELEARYGLLSDYDHCFILKGMKFASADGIYSSGFVIANQKYLVHTSDIWMILLMKLVGVRYKDIYMFDINGTTVQQTARLVYPQSLTWNDLIHLNISVLS